MLLCTAYERINDCNRSRAVSLLRVSLDSHCDGFGCRTTLICSEHGKAGTWQQHTKEQQAKLDKAVQRMCEAHADSVADYVKRRVKYCQVRSDAVVRHATLKSMTQSCESCLLDSM